MVTDGFPDGLETKNIFLSRRHGFDSWAWKIPWRRTQQPIPICLPGEFHGLRSLVGYSPQGSKRIRHHGSDLAMPTGKTTRPFRYDPNKISYNYTVEMTNRFKELDLIDRVPEEL